MVKREGDNILRREFINRSLKACVSIAFAGAASYLLYDPYGPSGDEIYQDLVTLPNFSVNPISGKTMCVVRGFNRGDGLERAIKLLGGIERFVKQGETVAIKPNVAFASSPELGATSHPHLISALVRLCFKARARAVIILDNPINAPASCFYLSGIEKAAQESGAQIILPKEAFFKYTSLENGRLIHEWPVFFDPLIKADKLIGVAPIKSHHRSGASMIMKNWYGLLGGRRNIFHQDIHTIISELSQLVRPTLVVLDGTYVMMNNGPTGGSISDLKSMETLIVSCDQVAADSFGSGLLGLSKVELPHIIKAEMAGVGTSDYHSLKPIFVNSS